MYSDERVSFRRILEEEAACKAAKACERLNVREYFHEPNEKTLPIWQAEGAFATGLDRRVVFVCESPSNIAKTTSPDFNVGGVDGYRCWAGYNWRTKAFMDARSTAGFGDCMMTNAVKCGCPSGVKDKPSPGETRRCSEHLRREIEFVQPGVIAYVGKWPYDNARPLLSSARLSVAPAHVYVTHYSAHSSPTQKQEDWAKQFTVIKRELAARDFPTDEPVWNPLAD